MGGGGGREEERRMKRTGKWGGWRSGRGEVEGRRWGKK